MNAWRLGLSILRHLGPRVVWLRGGVYLRNRLGVTRRVLASRPWDEIELAAINQPHVPSGVAEYAAWKRENAPKFLFPLGDPPSVPEHCRGGEPERQPAFRERMELLKQMRAVYFFRYAASEPIDWYANPIDGHRSEPGKHCADTPDYLPHQGDPRMLWEPARAAWAFDCARAGAHGFDGDPGQIFWNWVDSFMDACPPYQGFHWKCGQESSVRLIAVLFGFWSLAHDPATTPERYRQMARLAWATGYRVYHHIDYALSQKNNHATSEACGLLLASQLFPEFRDAARWAERGRRVLGDELKRQLYRDGSYLQQSMNYERVLLHGALLGMRLAEIAGRPLDREVYDLVGRAGEFLHEMTDPETGRAPLYGNNDGAYVLPLSECDFLDFRPVVQAVHYLVHRERRLPPGPWDEDLVWLFGAEALEGEPPPARPLSSRRFDDGGYYTLRRGESWAMVRCHSYRDRPGHCDPLQLDLWWRGQNMLQDCGTYHYYIPGRPDMEYYFKSIRSHNTIEIDGENPLELVSRFLWFPWPKAKLLRFEPTSPEGPYLEAEHHAYQRPPWNVLHRRAVIALADDAWVVIDDLLGSGEHQAVLRWHLLDAEHECDAGSKTVRLKTPRGDWSLGVVVSGGDCRRFEVMRGRDEPRRVQGFASPYYGELLPIPTLEAELHGPLPLRVITTLGPGRPLEPKLSAATDASERWTWHGPTGATAIELAGPARTAKDALIRRIESL